MRNYECPAYKKARSDCLKRDKRCRMPGCSSKKKLQVHHIVKWSEASVLRFELFNLITLCKKCHDSIKDKEYHYAPLFQEIIRGDR